MEHDGVVMYQVFPDRFQSISKSIYSVFRDNDNLFYLGGEGMNVSRYRSCAKSGLIALEEAVLGVMFEARHSNQMELKPNQISKYLGIPVLNRGSVYEYAIVQNILYRLELNDLVRQTVDKGPWVLTDKAIRRLEQN